VLGAGSVVLCAVLLAGCGFARVVKEGWSVAAHPIGQPVIEHGVVVGYVDSGDGLMALEGRDVETGELLWSFEARPGFAPRGIAVSPSVVDGYAAVLTPVPAGGYYGVNLIDVRTGEARFAVDPATGEPMPLAPDRRPTVCVDDEHLLCMAGRLVEPIRPTEFVIDPAAGTVAPAADALTDGGFWLSDELRMTADERLVRIARGAEVWSTSYQEVFGAGYTPAGGWSWYLHDDEGVFVGMARKSDPDDETRVSSELIDAVSVGLDAETGELVWREQATSTACRAADSAHDLRCRFASGRWTADAAAPDGYRLTDVDLILERFDPSTGATLWSVPLDDDVAVYSDGLPFAASSSELFLRSGGPVVAVDRRTGGVREMPTGVTYVCMSEPDIRLRRSGVEDAELVEYFAAPLLRVCDENGNDTVSLPPAAVVEELDEDDHGFVVIAEPGGYHSYRLE
jgi:outer membrane protein assembly factor BamB